MLALRCSDAAAITKHITNQEVQNGMNVTFTCAAIGHPAPSWTWMKDSTVIPSATSPSYSVGAAQSLDAATYTCIASNFLATVRSQAALSVNGESQYVNPSAFGYFTASL